MQFCSLFFFITPKSCKCYCKKKYSDVEWVHKDMLVLLVRSICSNNCSEVLAGTRVTGRVLFVTAGLEDPVEHGVSSGVTRY